MYGWYGWSNHTTLGLQDFLDGTICCTLRIHAHVQHI